MGPQSWLQSREDFHFERSRIVYKVNYVAKLCLWPYHVIRIFVLLNFTYLMQERRRSLEVRVWVGYHQRKFWAG